jgi:hypothetical protein
MVHALQVAREHRLVTRIHHTHCRARTRHVATGIRRELVGQTGGSVGRDHANLELDHELRVRAQLAGGRDDPADATDASRGHHARCDRPEVRVLQAPLHLLGHVALTVVERAGGRVTCRTSPRSVVDQGLRGGFDSQGAQAGDVGQGGAAISVPEVSPVHGEP